MGETALRAHPGHQNAGEMIGLGHRVHHQTEAVESADPAGGLVVAARHNLQGPCPALVHGFHPSALAGAETVDLKKRWARSGMLLRVASAGPEPAAPVAAVAKVVGHPETILQVAAIRPEAQLADARAPRVEALAFVEPQPQAYSRPAKSARRDLQLAEALVSEPQARA